MLYHVPNASRQSHEGCPHAVGRQRKRHRERPELLLQARVEYLPRYHVVGRGEVGAKGRQGR